MYKNMFFRIGPAGLALITLLGGLITNAQSSSSNIAARPAAFGKVPLYFEENSGQADGRARYIARGGGQTAFVTHDGLVLAFDGQSIAMHIADANPNAEMAAEGALEGVSNYYLGNRSFRGLKHFSSVRVSNILPDMDVVYHASAQNLEYDVVIRPGANPSAFHLRFEGSPTPLLNNEGDLVFKTASGEMIQRAPRVWQRTGGRRVEIACRYVLLKPGEVRLQLSQYDSSRDLVVDPILSYSTYLAGTAQDNPTGIAADSTGFAYVTGYTASLDFPVTAGSWHGSYDAFVAKLNANGTELVYSTFIGGSSQDQANAIAVDAGNAYITGFTYSIDFPFTSGHYLGGYTDAFTLKLDSSGNIAYALDLGGSYGDAGTAIAADNTGAAYVAGYTSSPDFPITSGALKTKNGANTNAFVVKISTAGEIVYATYLGGTSNDTASGIAADSLGNAYIGGTATSANFPVTKSAFSKVLDGGQDAFIAKLNPSGSALVYATYLGGSAYENAGGLAIDAAGDCYVTGTTGSTDFPTTPGAFTTTSPEYRTSWYVTKLNATGTKLVYSTYLLGSPSGSSVSIAVNSTGSAYVSGTSAGAFEVTPGALRIPPSTSYYYENDVFLVKLSPAGTELSYSTLLGSTNATADSSSLALDGKGGVYITGVTTSATFPVTAGAFEPTDPKSSGGQSGFVTKINLNSLTLCEPSVSPSSQALPGRGGAIAFALTLAPGCPWEAIPNGITLNNRTHGVVTSSPIQVTGTVGQNNYTGGGQTLSVAIGAATFTVNQGAGSCQDPVLSPTAVSYDSGGGLRNINLVLPSGCSWTAVSSAPWLSITADPSGTGPATIEIFAGQNSFSTRAATLTIDGKSVAVTQSGGKCTAVASATPLNFPGNGSTGTVSITTSAGSCDWSSYSTVPWIDLVPQFSNGQGSAIAPFVVGPNPGSVARTGSILMADKTLTITQAAGPFGSPSSYTVSIVAGGGSNTLPNLGDGGPASSAYLSSPAGLAYDSATRDLYIVDAGSSRIRVVTPDGNINTFAGGGSSTAEGVSALSAQLVAPQRVAVDPYSSVYVNDSSNRVRKISGGVINTFAGSTSAGFGGDYGAPTAAFMNYVRDIAADTQGNIYIVDQNNNRIRRVSGGIITTFAGGGTNVIGDGGPAALATLFYPSGVAVDAKQNVYIADTDDDRIREVIAGEISTLAQVPYITDVTTDSLGNVFAGSYSSFEMISPTGTVTNLNTYYGMNGLAADQAGDVYLSDPYSSVVRELTPVPSFCSYAVNAPSAHVSPAGQTVTITVTAAGGCNWTAYSGSSFAVIASGNTGSSGGKVSVTFAPNNTGSMRTATLTIAGQVITLIQNDSK